MKTRARNFIRISWIIASESSTIHAQLDPAARNIEAAKKESALVWYRALNLNDSEMLTSRFEQLYPFIKTETLRLSSFSLMSKIQTEARAGAFKADVIEIAGVLGHILKKVGSKREILRLRLRMTFVRFSHCDASSPRGRMKEGV